MVYSLGDKEFILEAVVAHSKDGAFDANRMHYTIYLSNGLKLICVFYCLEDEIRNPDMPMHTAFKARTEREIDKFISVWRASNS